MTLKKQILKFVVVGGSAFIIDFGILYFLTETVGIDYLVSNCISFTASTIYNYIASIYWVFKTNFNRNRSSGFLVFTLLSLIGLGFNQLINWINVDRLNMNYILSKIIATMVVMIYNFITRKLFLERNERDDNK